MPVEADRWMGISRSSEAATLATEAEVAQEEDHSEEPPTKGLPGTENSAEEPSNVASSANTNNQLIQFNSL